MTESTVGIITTVVGDYSVNCYIVYSPLDRIGVIIDPGDDAKRIQEKVGKSNLTIQYVLNTHCHGDHVGAVKPLVESLDAKYGRSEKETPLLESSYNRDLVSFLGLPMPPNADLFLKDGEILEVSPNLTIQVIETPGHTPGGLCFLVNNEILFTGDSLFRMSIGRTDFPLSNHGDLIQSLKTKILTLPEQIEVYPGHESSSTIGFEKANNPFLQGHGF